MTLLQGARILIVDDEDLIRSIFHSEFTSHGAQCQTAANITEAWQKIQQGPFDILISDVRMSGGDGVKLVERIHHELGYAVKKFFCSAYNDVCPEKARALGILEIFPKPFDLEVMVKSLAEHLSK